MGKLKSLSESELAEIKQKAEALPATGLGVEPRTINALNSADGGWDVTFLFSAVASEESERNQERLAKLCLQGGGWLSALIREIEERDGIINDLLQDNEESHRMVVSEFCRKVVGSSGRIFCRHPDRETVEWAVMEALENAVKEQYQGGYADAPPPERVRQENERLREKLDDCKNALKAIANGQSRPAIMLSRFAKNVLEEVED